MDKKKLRQKRTMRYFIDAASQIFEEEGLDKITIRNVANLAGFNGATLYSYFKDRNHLLCFLAVSKLKGYLDDLQVYLTPEMNSLERFLMVCHCFADHAFRNAKICLYLYEKPTETIHHFNDYYFVFPEDIESMSEDIRKMMTSKDYIIRNRVLIEKGVEEGFFYQDDVSAIAMLINYTFEGSLRRLALSDQKTDQQTCRLNTVQYDRYIEKILSAYLREGVKMPTVIKEHLAAINYIKMDPA